MLRRAPALSLAQAHATSCRAVRFSGGGELLYSGSTDCSILAADVASGKAQARKKEAHDSAINRLATISASGLASGGWRHLHILSQALLLRAMPWRPAAVHALPRCSSSHPVVAVPCIPPSQWMPACIAGDDDGVIKMWDSRQSEATCTLEAHLGKLPSAAVPAFWCPSSWSW